ncbi:formin-1-like [Phasianus colchicus]|uniref:formin-1-like n=1 Tax=Phasianus colchicus TaxID=9054 RepID=UPI00129E2097|nr:formin-1-like [Phasianus colchicus]
MTTLASIMEGTHTILQLHKPIMELCYISFYLPEGKVRGFTYRGCVTLDRTSKRFCNCYKVQERLEMREQPYENFRDIIFMQTTTKDILTELYRLIAEKEKLLSSLLRSHHILGLNKGYQEEKKQAASAVTKLNCDDCSSFEHHQEFFLDSAKRGKLNGKKMRKYRRKESFDELRHWKGRNKLREQHPSLLRGQGMQVNNEKMLPTRLLSTRSFPSFFSASSCVTAKGKDYLSPDVGIQPARGIKEGYFPESSKAMKLDADLTSSVSKDNGDKVAAELLDNAECVPEVINVQQSIMLVKSSQDNLSNNLEKLSKSAVPKILKNVKCTDQVYKKKPGFRIAAEVQDSEACDKTAKTHAESLSDFHQKMVSPVLTTVHNVFGSRTDGYLADEAAGYSRNSVLQEEEQDGSVLKYKAERVHITDESCNLVGAVNKALLKVIRSDSLDEAAEWKRLKQITRVDKNLPGSVYEKRTTVSWGNNKHLFLNLPVNEDPDVSQTSNKLEEKKLHSPSLVAVSNVFSNSYLLSNTHKQMSPIPSPLSSRLPTPQLHHRILPLPAQNSEDEPMFGDYCSGRQSAINLSFNDLEPPFYLKFSEPGELGFAIRQPRLHQNATAGQFEKRTLQERLTTQTKQNFCAVETALKDDFTERLTNLDVANRDEDTWVLDSRLGLSSPFAHSSEKEKINRNALHLSLELNWHYADGRHRAQCGSVGLLLPEPLTCPRAGWLPARSSRRWERCLRSVPPARGSRTALVTRNQSCWVLFVALQAEVCISNETCRTAGGSLSFSFLARFRGARSGQPRPESTAQHLQWKLQNSHLGFSLGSLSGMMTLPRKSLIHAEGPCRGALAELPAAGSQPASCYEEVAHRHCALPRLGTAFI